MVSISEVECPFCEAEEDRVFVRRDGFLCLWDGFPVAEGHALVIPSRHFSNWFDATLDEQVELLEGIELARQEIERRYQPNGYNIGINVGEAAGQTVNHLHIHVIPRYSGDVRDPRGGVRHVIPGKGNYFALRKDVQDSGESYIDDTVKQAVYGSAEKPLLAALGADIASSSSVEMAVAFVTQSGLSRIAPYLIDLLERNGRIRFLTGDYLDVTEPAALYRLHDWVQEYSGQVQVRVFRTDKKIGFHPKAYLVHQDYAGVTAYIGSSNLTRHALESGIEWNQRIEGNHHDSQMASIVSEFDALFRHPKSLEITPQWIDEYSKRRQVSTPISSAMAVDLDEEGPGEAATPHPIQQEALYALKATRDAGNRAGLVVMATGLGKTWLGAFDSVSFDRVLFVAHREEILRQALNTFRQIRPGANLGYYKGGQYDHDADVLFASVQTLGRKNHLAKFDSGRFDYIVVDEFHHAAAPTYRRLIDYFKPKFLLGLTATPERTDGGDLLALCGENLVFRCDLVDGINQELLSPFHYYGVRDEIDFSNIPWRSGRFDPKLLEYAVATEVRAQNAFEQWQKRAQTRTLAFCVSMRHADYMDEYFRSRGVKSVAVHSGPDSAPRTQSLIHLEEGELQIIFAVDMFNEGVDVPSIDTVMMLRPTESKILWLQQFGRGLRRAEGKSHLSVIDYIGNHRSFLQVPMVLLPGAGSRPGEVNRALMKLEQGALELPAGCSIEYELEALNILKQLATPTAVSEQMTLWYRSFRELHDRRPSATEAFHEGYGPKNVRTGFGSWFGFVKSEGDLSSSQAHAFDAHREFLERLEKTQMTKSFKMVVLQSMLMAGSFPGSINIDDLVSRVQEVAGRLQLLREEFGNELDDAVRLQALLERNPIDAWTGGQGMGGKQYFKYDGNIFSSFEVEDQHSGGLADLVREISDWRLAKYLSRSPEFEREPKSTVANGTLQLWHEYMREEIPPLWGLTFNSAKWQQGVVREGDDIFLLVSLNKQGMAEEHQYEDKFLSATSFQWLSQNRTKRDSGVGKMLRDHEQIGKNIQLFVRDRRKTPSGKAAPFVYCGNVRFVDWEGDQPITVRWRLSESLPESLANRFGL